MTHSQSQEHIHDQFQLIKKLDDIGVVVGVFPSVFEPHKYQEQYDETAQLLLSAVAKAKTFPDFDKMCTYKITYPNFQAFSKNNLCKWVTQRLFFVSLHHVCT